jgi:hypothetical protein
MSQSKIYNVKSNAARAAAKHGLSRKDLMWSGDNGWWFEIPEDVVEVVMSKFTQTEESLVSSAILEELCSMEKTLDLADKEILEKWQDFPPSEGDKTDEEKEVSATPTQILESQIHPVGEDSLLPIRDALCKLGTSEKEPRRQYQKGLGASVIEALNGVGLEVVHTLMVTGWQSHTLRGFISTYAKKACVTIEAVKEGRKVTMYRVAKVEG